MSIEECLIRGRFKNFKGGGGGSRIFFKRGVQPLTRGNLYWKQTKFSQKGGCPDPLDLPLFIVDQIMMFSDVYYSIGCC